MNAEMEQKEQLVVIGNGMAGVKCVENILELSSDRFHIVMLGNEPHPNYNRILLSKVLQGDTRLEDITLHPWDWYEQHGITLYANERVKEIDTHHSRVMTVTGRQVRYDHLIVATGSSPFILPIPGADKVGVTAFRTIADCERLVQFARTCRKAIVIGGGLLGLEAARGLLNLGMAVSVVHIHHQLMERQLDETASTMLRSELEEQGMTFLLNKRSMEITGTRKVTGLRFTDGTEEEADLIVMAVGIRPNVNIARQAGLQVDQGIVVDDYMRTSVPRVYAVGECAQHRGIAYGLVAPLYEQGEVLARSICQLDTLPYEGSILYTQLKVSGVDVFSAGDFRGGEDSLSIRYHNPVTRVYSRITTHNGRIAGGVMVGDTTRSNLLLDAIRQESTVEEWQEVETAARASGGGISERAANMAVTETVCACNAVTKGRIVTAIQSEGCHSLKQVKQCTKASASCGGCQPLVEAILTQVLSDDQAPAEENRQEAICACTTLSHAEVKEIIYQSEKITFSQMSVRKEWRDPEGCDMCRKTFDYYQSLKEGRIAGDVCLREQDGTIRVILPLPGGVVSAGLLNRLLHVVDECKVPLVRTLRSGDLELAGIQEADADAVLAAIAGMGQPLTSSTGYPVRVAAKSGHAASAGWTGTMRWQVSTGEAVSMAAEFQRSLAFLHTPAPLMFMMSGTTAIEDQLTERSAQLMVRESPLGWEVCIQKTEGEWSPADSNVSLGAAGEAVRIRVAAGLNKNELLPLLRAIVQYYRFTAYYMEQIWDWGNRVGWVDLKEKLLQPAWISSFDSLCSNHEQHRTFAAEVAEFGVQRTAENRLDYDSEVRSRQDCENSPEHGQSPAAWLSG
ncbi:nitrite reductase large subunit NirB [Marinicrinis sediminis]|uniref:Nitrite reductase large subunit NirB n=1 Tax=Marinicrinis sediminis TaxID=1652465 RepID=A0ABW5R6F1_9BACL